MELRDMPREEILRAINPELRVDSGIQKTRCPLDGDGHAHKNGDARPSFHVNTETGWAECKVSGEGWSTWKQAAGRLGLDWLALVRAKNGDRRRDGGETFAERAAKLRPGRKVAEEIGAAQWVRERYMRSGRRYPGEVFSDVAYLLRVGEVIHGAKFRLRDGDTWQVGAMKGSREKYANWSGSKLKGVILGSDLIRDGATLLLCAGEKDFCCALSHLDPDQWAPLTGCTGEGDLVGGLAELARGRRVVIAYDGDAAGRLGAVRNAIACENGGAAEVRVARPPEGQDLADVWRSLRDSGLERLLAEAGPLPVEWALEAGKGSQRVRSEVGPWLRRAGAGLPGSGEHAPLFEAEVVGAAGGDDPPEAEPEPDKETVAQALVRIASECCELFTDTGNGGAYATISVNGHRETHALNSSAFREWLCHQGYLEGRVPSSSAVRDAIGVLSGLARFEGEAHKVHVRVARADDGSRIWLDLCDPDWRAVEVSAEGWRVVDSAPVRFRRAKGAGRIPEPVPGGSVEDFFSLVNCAGADVEARVKGWLLGAMRGDGPFLLLIAQGEQGAAKSFLCNMLRELIDPNTAGLRATPADERDLAIAASNSWVVAYDNLSGLPGWLSDSLCRIATGAGFATRALYTDSEEALFSVSRPVLLNGIDDVATRPDLAERSLSIHLEAISPERRKEESWLLGEFERRRPAILGALLDAVAESIRGEASVRLERLPRMADAARWVTAGERAMGLAAGEFVRAMEGGQEASQVAALEAHPVAGALLAWFHDRGQKWRGSAADLLGEIEQFATDNAKRGKGWPRSPAALTGKLRRLAPALRVAEIAVTMGRGRSRWVQVEAAAVMDAAAEAELEPAPF